jgi:fermentation-respiration switch protein FrsA (DUF1100 family)
VGSDARNRATAGASRHNAHSAAALLLAHHPKINAIVADSAYATLEDLIGSHFFFLPGPLKWPPVALTTLYAKLFVGVNVDAAASVEAVRTLRTPLLLIHGEADSQIPVDHAHRLAANADPSLTEVWIVPGAEHGHARAIAGPRDEARVRRFFTQHLCAQSTPVDSSWSRRLKGRSSVGQCHQWAGSCEQPAAGYWPAPEA